MIKNVAVLMTLIVMVVTGIYVKVMMLPHLDQELVHGSKVIRLLLSIFYIMSRIFSNVS